MNILFLGLGSIAKKHIAALQKIDEDCTIYALRSSPEAETFGEVRNIASLNALPVHPDFAIIDNPTHVHFDSIKKVLPLGCPLFIEKPVVRTTKEADELEKLLHGGPMTYVACVLRHHPCLQFVRDTLKETLPRINEVNAYCGSFLPDWTPGKDWKKSFRADPQESGGVHMELIHEMDYLAWIFGQPVMTKNLLRNVSSLQMQAPDFAHTILTYPDFTALLTLNYYRRDAKRTLEIVFEDQTWTVDLLTFSVTSNGKMIFSSPQTMADLYCTQMRYFLDCLKNEHQPMNSAEEACSILRLTLS